VCAFNRCRKQQLVGGELTHAVKDAGLGADDESSRAVGPYKLDEPSSGSHEVCVTKYVFFTFRVSDEQGSYMARSQF
jgi:hypothetical protein